MLKSFGTIDDMLVAIDADKNVTGSNAGTANRFPVRFVLFDNFRDSYEFISKMSDKDIEIQSVDKWMNPQYDDMFISRIELANNIEKYIGDINGEDCVVAPFSELARFYDNIEHKEFDALITKLKSIQSTNIAFDKHQRIYIVIVGQYSKISNFENDPQMFAWYLKSDDKQFNYRLVLSNGTDYDVRNLKNRYTVVNNLKEWLYLWRNGIDIANTIISTSPSIYAYEQNALPDNAFDFDKCENVYKFLTLG
ncbi:BREX-4 system phosphatase PglZ [Bacteroides xylanisolvens]|nr:BREX-4 system phosphatase PglZ [Bacteroides xylanisolvens]